MMHEFDTLMTLLVETATSSNKSDNLPIAAMILDAQGETLSVANNMKSAVEHAETLAIQEACQKLGSDKLRGCTLITTLEPCIMCAGAILNAQLDKVVFGAWDEKFGASGSVWDLLRDPRASHHPEVFGGVLADECSALMTQFFEARR
jgi:tRNA(adenine34) deaminase